MNCTNQLTQPDMQFKIGNKQYTLPASSYVMDVSFLELGLFFDHKCFRSYYKTAVVH